MRNPRRIDRGFTLIEMLVVIAVIAVLVALLLPATRNALEAGQKTRARAEISSIVTAIKQYNNEYGKYPLPNRVSQNEEWNGGTDDVNYGYAKGPSGNEWDSNQVLFYVLRAVDTGTFSGSDRYPNEDHVRNLRRIQFLETGDYHLAPAGSGSDPDEDSFIDPWGMPYEITIDANFNNSCEDVGSRDDGGNWSYGDLTNHTVVVWSRGPDRTASVTNDNLRSWE